MQDHLLFRLDGPMQSWGGVAVGGLRPSDSRPTRSGVLGLLAAALGIRRHEEARLQALDHAFALAMREDAPGVRMTDFHTIQTTKEKSKRTLRTRKDELGGKLLPGEDLSTVLSQREYLVDACFTVCVWAVVESPPVSVRELEQALRTPAFCLSLGRKSCPPSRTMKPNVIQAQDYAQALLQHAEDRRNVPLFVDHGHAAAGWEIDMTLTRRDAVAQRNRRQFELRGEDMLRRCASPDAAGESADESGGAS